LPLGTASNVLDVSPIAVGQAKVFHEVLHVATWAFYIKSGLQHDWAQKPFR
jgi:hypothetical protein